MRKIIIESKEIDLHLIFSSGVIPESKANADKNSKESTKLFLGKEIRAAVNVGYISTMYLIIIEQPKYYISIDVEYLLGYR